MIVKNLFDIYLPICDNVMCFDNSDKIPRMIFNKIINEEIEIKNSEIFKQMNNG